jgi:L-ascorbate oxidase
VTIWSRQLTDYCYQGIAGAIYVAPSPDRPRPYHLVTNNNLELRQIREAERNIRHVIVQNHQHRDTVWKLLRMRAEGSEYYCYDSILVNGNNILLCVHQSKLI